MNRYIIEYKINNKFHAGSKAKEDIIKISKKNKFKLIELSCRENRFSKIMHILTMKSNLKDIKKDSIILIQWPIYSEKFFYSIIRGLKNKNCKIIMLIHDIDSLRFKRIRKINKEIKKLNQADILIAHNYKMKEWLLENGITKKIVDLKIFDYIINPTLKINLSEKTNFKYWNIVFAGNLSIDKSAFIYKLDNIFTDNINLNLYGPNLENNILNENIHYHGKFLPEELPGKINGDYGLIWDGISVDKCSGAVGEYMKYNNPHKLSLYIASGIPVIVWKESAISKFVKDNKIGIIIENLNDLHNKINLNLDNYNEHKKNILNLRKKIIGGEYTLKALENSIEFLQ